MALTAQQVYNQSLGVQRGRVNQMYGRNLEILARQMRDASERLASNLEGRGIFRSGEATTARERLAEDEAAQRKYLSEDRSYQLSQIDLDERARQASQAASGGGGGSPARIMPSTAGKTPEDILRQAGFNPDAYKASQRPIGSRLIFEVRKPGTVQTTRQRAM